MNAEVTVRTATIHDCADIQRIYNESVATSTASYDVEAQSVESRAAWLNAHLTDDLPVIVAVVDGVVVGWAALSAFRSKAGYRFTVEDSIYIDETYRGRGIGKKLLATLIEAARARDLHVIVAAIDSESDISIRLHAEFGFEKVAHLREVGRKFDRWLDVIYMQLILSEG